MVLPRVRSDIVRVRHEVRHMKYYYLLVLFLFSLTLATNVYAADLVMHEIDAPATPVDYTIDERVIRLGAYLETHNSPMAEAASHFVFEADRLNLDWKLLPAIAGVESTFGKRIPPGSYNSYGWGIFTGKSSGIVFDSWADGITKVSEGLRYRYMDRGATTVEQIGRIYAASPTWAIKVRFFMGKIDEFEATDVSLLAFTI